MNINRAGWKSRTHKADSISAGQGFNHDDDLTIMVVAICSLTLCCVELFQSSKFLMQPSSSIIPTNCLSSIILGHSVFNLPTIFTKRVYDLFMILLFVD